MLTGLDIIKKFRLCQDHNLNISHAKIENEKKENSEEETFDKKVEINWNEHIPYELFEANTNHLNQSRREKVHNLIDKYGSVFAKDAYDIGTVSEKLI